MTRKEAIETLKLLKPNMRFDDSGWLYIKQAVDMAIQALSQEPCDDAISREKEQKNDNRSTKTSAEEIR